MPSPCGGFRVIPLCLRQDVAIFSLEPKFEDGVTILKPSPDFPMKSLSTSVFLFLVMVRGAPKPYSATTCRALRLVSPMHTARRKAILEAGMPSMSAMNISALVSTTYPIFLERSALR